jgi:hypothetical protein
MRGKENIGDEKMNEDRWGEMEEDKVGEYRRNCRLALLYQQHTFLFLQVTLAPLRFIIAVQLFPIFPFPFNSSP